MYVYFSPCFPGILSLRIVPYVQWTIGSDTGRYNFHSDILIRFYDKDISTLYCTEVHIRSSCPRKLHTASQIVEEQFGISIRSKRSWTRRTSWDIVSNLLPVTVEFHSVSEIGSQWTLSVAHLCREATERT
jgi:hypothetical protein